MAVKTACVVLVVALGFAEFAAADQRWLRQERTATSAARAFLVEGDEVGYVVFGPASSATGWVRGWPFSTVDTEDIAWLRSIVHSAKPGTWLRVAAVDSSGKQLSGERYIRWSLARSIRRTTFNTAPALEVWLEWQNYSQPTIIRIIDKADVDRIVTLARVP